MSLRDLPSTPNCTVGMGPLGVQFYRAETIWLEVSVGAAKRYVIYEIGLKSKQLGVSVAHLCIEAFNCRGSFGT